MKLNTRSWLLFSLFNLFVVALLGTLMRYKIGFSFPYFDQKNLQHAHSHFAFVGWIGHTLMVLMVDVVQRNKPDFSASKYKAIIIANLICAFGMVFSFAAQGYGAVSISFSTISVILSYVFAFYFFRELKSHTHAPFANWFTAALWFSIISSLGTFTLAFMMASHNFDQKIHLSSLYFYLHFQYNGYFFFACIGLLFARIKELLPSFQFEPRIFWMFCIACIPAYFLSVLWAKLPVWLYVVVVLSAILQFCAWIKLLVQFRRAAKQTFIIMNVGKFIFYILIIAVSVKLILQLGSTIPALSKLAFGFRSIIIAYLHLILLAIISVFLICYLHVFNFIRNNKTTLVAIVIFVAAVYLNEIVLSVQGIASFSYTPVPFVNEMLFAITLMILSGAGLLLMSQRRGEVKADDPGSANFFSAS